MSSTADIDDALEVSTDGITVRKRFVAAAFPVPAIRFEINSDHDDAVFVRFSERIPDRFPMENIGFHPEYHSESWTAFQDNHIEFAGTLEAGESLVTVYGMQIDEDDVGTEFLGEPTILEVRSDGSAGGTTDPDEVVLDRSDEDADAAAESDERRREDDGVEEAADDAVVPAESADTDERERRADSGSDPTTVDPAASDSPPEARSDDHDGDVAHRIDVITDSDAARDPSDEIDVGSSDRAAENEAIGADGSESAPAPAESEPALTTRLVAELREGAVEESELETLRTELAVDPAPSDRAKIEHLQLRVEELAAYTNALEQFLDEEGTGHQLTERFAAVEDDLGTVEDRLEDTESRVDDLETDLEAVRDDLTEIQAWRDQLGSMFSDR